MKISYDYEELIGEIREELRDGSLKEQDIIQVLRDKKPINKTYYPIIDWYYSESRMVEILSPDVFDDLSETDEKDLLKKHYLKDKPRLRFMSVKSVLDEMEKWNSII